VTLGQILLEFFGVHRVLGGLAYKECLGVWRLVRFKSAGARMAACGCLAR
jgi:hypothetical protein